MNKLKEIYDKLVLLDSIFYTKICKGECEKCPFFKDVECPYDLVVNAEYDLRNILEVIEGN